MILQINIILEKYIFNIIINNQYQFLIKNTDKYPIIFSQRNNKYLIIKNWYFRIGKMY